MTQATGYRPEDSIDVHYPEAVEWRRTLHKCPQPSWLEFFATAFVAEKLTGWGYDVKQGRDVVAEDKLLLLPGPEILQEEYDRALKAGAIGEIPRPGAGRFHWSRCHPEGRSARPDGRVPFRHRLQRGDGSPRTEPTCLPGRASCRRTRVTPTCAATTSTRPRDFCWQSISPTTARRSRAPSSSSSSPTRRISRGLRAMIEKGILDDLDYIVGGHIGLSLKETGLICFNVHSFLALSRFEVTFTGRPTHAAASPEQGKNAMLGACNAVTNLYAIARHSQGATRINVGTSRRAAPGTSSRRRPTSAWRHAA